MNVTQTTPAFNIARHEDVVAKIIVVVAVFSAVFLSRGVSTLSSYKRRAVPRADLFVKEETVEVFTTIRERVFLEEKKEEKDKKCA